MITLIIIPAFIISALFIHMFLNPKSRFHILDRPNERSLHGIPVPRSGGIAIILSFILCLVGVMAYSSDLTQIIWIISGVFIVAAISFIDDLKGVAPAYRMFVHSLAVCVLLGSGSYIVSIELPGALLEMPVLIGLLISILFGVWMINLYNFMDGMDGFSGGMSVFGFGTLAMLGSLKGYELFTILNLIIVGSSIGFLVFNFPPARIFMGDVGSATLGYLAVVMIYWADKEKIFPFWISLLVFSPFIIDATVTLIRRSMQGRKIWQAHSTHYYQRLVKAGWGHRKTVLVEYGIMLGCSLTAILVANGSVTMQMVALFFWGLFYTSFFLWVTYYERIRHSGTGT
ncbi:MAG: glycosyltransferase family 4 protein [Gammaproteobacteria bacterium]|nr:glycosyltransferase family 4 protein [Gammaproteobacteria bacterium]